MKIYKHLILSALALLPSFCQAQDKPIGYWRSHMPYNTAVSVATDGNLLFTACQQSFFTYNEANGDVSPYSKVEGMSDVGMSYVAYDVATNTTVLAYKNSNIDLFQNNTFYNIPDLKNKAVSGVKNINHIFTENGFAYVSTDIGILVIDLTKREIKESYIFTHNKQVLSITGFSAAGSYYYAITPSGLYRVNKSIPDVQNFAAWTHVDSNNVFTNITTVSDQLFVATYDSVFTINADTLKLVYQTTKNINHIDPAKGGLWISEVYRNAYKSIANKLDISSYQLVDSFHPKWISRQIAELTDGSVWVADEAAGLGKRNGNSINQYVPNGPSAPTAFDIYANNKEVWVAHGGFSDTWRANGNKTGFSGFTNGNWQTYTYDRNSLYNPYLDFVTITKSPVDGSIYAGSFQNGLYVLKPNGTNYVLQTSLFDENPNNVGLTQVAGVAFDNSNNLWVSMFGSPHNLLVKTPDSTWYKYSFRTQNYPSSGGPITFDDYNQEWIVSSDGGGVIVYNNNNTPANASDDQVRLLSTGVGYGNLPSNFVFCLAKDKNGDIWVGTNNGIGTLNCAGSIFTGCDAQIPIVQYDQYAGYLFAGENVRSIAVDGANRKWVGTDNGIWLLSPDASKIIYRFTQDNSPLPSNHIEKISIDPVTGDVYLGTEQGLISYHSTSTEGGTSNKDVLTYPNPVPSHYNGTVAIKGLVANADVRITDVSGQLVYRTTALGGQAVWNGLDYTGHRPQSGVYLIFVTNADGSQTYAGKMVFLQ